MKNLMKCGAIAATIVLGGAPNAAHAVSLEEYLECVANGGSLINCAFGNGNDSYANVRIPKEFEPNKNEAEKIEAMVRRGDFAKLDVKFAKEGSVFRGTIRQSCKTETLLAMIEKGMGLERIGKNCFEPHK